MPFFPSVLQPVIFCTLMLMRLFIGSKSEVLLIHMPTEMEMRLVVQSSRVILNTLTDGLAKLKVFLASLCLKNMRIYIY